MLPKMEHLYVDDNQTALEKILTKFREQPQDFQVTHMKPYISVLKDLRDKTTKRVSQWILGHM